MIYVYSCEPCSAKVDVIKSVKDIDRPETCATCGSPMIRAFAPAKIHLYGTSVQEKKWQPSLGRAATDSEMKAEAKAKGWIEVGNEKQEKHLKPQGVDYPSFSEEDIRQLTSKP